MKTTVVLPTYNESQNIVEIASALLELPVDDLSILVVDDNSPDGTGQIADSLAAKHPERVEILHRLGKKGLGSAYVEGFTHAINTGAEAIIQMDADFSHAPRYIPKMLEELRGCDVVVGSRYVPGGSVDEHWGWGRRMLSKFANTAYARLILRLHVQDVTAGFKIWKKETLLGIDLRRVNSNGYVFQVEMAYLAERLGYRALELPIYFEDRRIGRSKMSLSVKFEAAWRTLQVFRQHGKLTPADRKQ